MLHHPLEIPVRWIYAGAWALHYESVVGLSPGVDWSLGLCISILLFELVVNWFRLGSWILLLALILTILCDCELTFKFWWILRSKNWRSWIPTLRFAWIFLLAMIARLLNLGFGNAAPSGCIPTLLKRRPRSAHIVIGWLGNINGIESSLESTGL